MELSSASVLAFEFGVPCMLMLVLALSDAFGTRLTKRLILVVAAVQLIAVVFRPADYNTDTSAYDSYIDLLAGSSGNELLLLTKFEPLHLLLAVLTQDFRWWLIAENVVGLVLLWTLCRRTARLETLAVVLGCALPLFSSSVRFGNGLLAVACVLAIHQTERGRMIVTTFVGGLTHVSLLMVGILQRRQWLPTALILLGFVAFALVDEDVRGRAGGGDEDEFKGAGLRSFLGCVMLMLYLRARLPDYRHKLFTSDLLSALGVFLLSMLFFPVVNRWLILLMIVMAVDADAPLAKANLPRGKGGIAALALYAALMLPFLYKLATTWGAEALAG